MKQSKIESVGCLVFKMPSNSAPGLRALVGVTLVSENKIPGAGRFNERFHSSGRDGAQRPRLETPNEGHSRPRVTYLQANPCREPVPPSATWTI